MTAPNSAQPPSDIPENHHPGEVTTNPQALSGLIDLIFAKFNWIRRVKSIDFVVLFITVILATIPPLLVMGDRWFQLFPREFLNDYWCKSIYFCKSMLPSYFLIIIACLLGLLFIMYFERHQAIVIVENKLVPLETLPVSPKQTKVGLWYLIASIIGFIGIVIYSLFNQHYPGWSLVYVWLAFLLGCALYSIPQGFIREFWRNKGDLWIALLLAHGSIVGILVGLYSQPSLLLGTLVLLMLAMANLWRFRQQIPLIFWIISLALIVYTINIDGWWTAAVGDEFVFYGSARELAEKASFSDWGNKIFNANGVNGTHPYFSTVLQAISMKIFGFENFGWRFSNPYLVSIGVGLFYLFCKTFISRHMSLLAAFLLAISSCIMSFAKIGYNNLQALFAFTLVLAVTAWVLRTKSLLSFAFLGSALALCFYVYPAGLYVPPISFVLLILYYPPKNRETLKHWLVIISVCLALIFPLMLQPIYWQSKVMGTVFNQPDLYQSFPLLVSHIFYNLVYASFSFLYISSESHFIASSYLDPITSMFFLIGFGFLIYHIRHHRFTLFVVISYVFFIFSVGVSHDRDAPPNTRMFLFLPLYVLIAAWGIKWVAEKGRHIFPISIKASLILNVIFMVGITGINLYQAYPLSHFRFSHKEEIESLFIRISQHVSKVEPKTIKNYAVIVDETWGIGGLMVLKEIYPHLAWARVEEIRIKTPALPEAVLPLLRDRNTIVILMPWFDPAWVIALDEPLKALEKKRCVISTSGNDARFILYHHPDLPQACYP